MAGAVREDDSGSLTEFLNVHVLSSEPEPKDDPWGNFNRFCNHFFDPVNNTGYTKTCGTIAQRAAPVWALAIGGPFTIPQTAGRDLAIRNHFTIGNARDEMWTALTGLGRDGQVRAPDRAARLRSWATVFRALGDVLHLNQDMAQPQHTRDEGHGLREAAWYEKYIDGRAKGLSTVTYEYPPGIVIRATNLSPLSYAGYPIPAFNRYGDFWSTGVGSAVADAKGLADYSNRSFFTPAENFGRTRYSLPASDRSLYTENKRVRDNGRIDLYLDRSVHDSLLGIDSRPIHMTRSSLFDQQLVLVAGEIDPLQSREAFSIDRDVFDDRAELLIPRAVAYSAGLLDYFFRGQLSIGAPGDGVYALVDHAVEKDPLQGGFSTLKAKVANATPGEAMSAGMLAGVLKFKRDTCYVDDLSGLPTSSVSAFECRTRDEEIVVSNALDLPSGLSTDPTEFTFTFSPKLPINATDVRFQVVYRGVLGNEEDAVAVATKDLSEPTYFTYHNASDYARIGDHVYSRADINNDPALLAKVFPQSCVDYAQSPPQLAAGCLQPFVINLVLGSGTTPKTVTIRGLPVGRFARFAFHADPGQATFDQLAYTCLPPEPFTFNAVKWQIEADPYTGAQSWNWPLFVPLRGLMGWQQTACVLAGDGVLSDTPDDRDVRLSAVTERYPFPVEISP